MVYACSLPKLLLGQIVLLRYIGIPYFMDHSRILASITFKELFSCILGVQHEMCQQYP